MKKKKRKKKKEKKKRIKGRSQPEEARRSQRGNGGRIE